MLFKDPISKIEKFLSSEGKTISKFLVISVIAVVVYFFLNEILFGRFILDRAHYEQVNKNYSSAIDLYNIDYVYYSINRYSKENREKSFEISYNIAACYAKQGDREKSVKTVLDTLTTIQQTYGFFSWESAHYIRKYLTKFYFETGNYSLAYKEFNNLLLIYKKIGYNNSEMADLMTLCAELYSHQGDPDKASSLYKRAYKTISIQRDMDYTIFSEIVNKIANFDVQNKKTKDAIALYKKSIPVLKKSGEEQNELTAQMLLQLGDLYKQDSKTTKDAIKCYEEAIAIIEKLPSSAISKMNLGEYLTTLKGLYNKTNEIAKAKEIDVAIENQKRLAFFVF